MRTTMRFAAVVAIALLAACGNEPATETEAPIAQETVAPTPTPTPPATDDAGPCESTSAKSFEGRALITVTVPCAGDT
ncbi:MAG: hypothetical protein ACRDKB_10610, partial [Actinomycetota bacterium]